MRRIFSITIIIVAFAGLLFAHEADNTRALLAGSGEEVAMLQAMRGEQSAPQKTASSNRPRRRVDFMADDVLPYNKGGDSIVYFLGNFAAHHNGAVIACDSAVRYNDTRWGFFRNVIINQDSIYIYGDSAIYNGDVSLAEVYAPVVKVVDGDALLYTYNFRFNTDKKVGSYVGGGVLVHDNDILESLRGYYYSEEHSIVCVDNVEIHGSDYDMKGDSVIYNTDTKFARFFANTEIWNVDGEYLSADEGYYDNNSNLYVVTKNGYILTEKQEMWGDTLSYYRDNEHIIAHSDIQMDDIEHKMLAFGDYAEVWGDKKIALLTRKPVAISYDTTQGDTVFMSADTMQFLTISRLEEAREARRREIADSLAKAEQAQAEREALMERRKKFEADKADRDAKYRAKQESEATIAEKVETKETTASINTVSTTEQAAAVVESKIGTVEQNVGAHHAAILSDAVVTPPTQNVAQSAKAEKTITEEPKKSDTHTTSENKAVVANDDMSQVDAAVSADSMIVADSLVADSIALSPQDTLTGAALKAYLKQEAQREKEEKRKAQLLEHKQKLDTIAAIRRAKMIEEYERMQRKEMARLSKDSARRAEKRAKLLAKGRDVSALDAEDSLAVLEREKILSDSLPAHLKPSSGATNSGHDAAVDDLSDGVQNEALESDSSPVDSLATDSLQNDSLYRVVKAYRKVRIYRSDSQAICDSLVSNSTDSIVHMYIEPVMWNNNNQIAAAQVDAYTSNQQIIRAEFLSNPIMVSEVDTNYYNQVTGKLMIAYFQDNEIYRNDVDGNVQTIYFQREDEQSAIVTELVYLESASASFYIENREVVGITYRNDVPFQFYPIALIPESQMQRLPNFKWVPELRPTRENIFDRIIRPSEREDVGSRRRPSFRIVDKMDRYKERMMRQGLWIDREDELTPEIVEWRDSRDRN